jgi:hypothetical protein
MDIRPRWTLPGAILLSLATACGGDESSGGGGGGNPKKIDACAIVTQTDAEQLFEVSATLGKPSGAVDPALIGECVWEWEDSQANSQLLQFYVWEGASYYNPSKNSTPFAIGEKGSIDVSGGLIGVDVHWLQAGKTVDLSYFTVGSVPDANTKVDEVKALALAAATKLK